MSHLSASTLLSETIPFEAETSIRHGGVSAGYDDKWHRCCRPNAIAEAEVDVVKGLTNG